MMSPGTFWDVMDRGLCLSSCVEDTGNNVDVDDGQIDRHADTCTWSDILSRGTIGGKNVQQ